MISSWKHFATRDIACNSRRYLKFGNTVIFICSVSLSLITSCTKNNTLSPWEGYHSNFLKEKKEDFRRWADRIAQWVKAQGRYELERGIKMKPVENVAPAIPLAERFSQMNSLITLCTFCIGTAAIIYSVYP